MNNVHELDKWVAAKLKGVDAATVRKIQSEVSCHPERPEWGEDFDDFLDGLPEDLTELD